MRFLSLTFVTLMLPLFVSTGQQKGADANPRILPVNESSLVKELQKSKGHVLLVNVWASWCVPCIEEFPDLLKLRHSYRERGVDIVFISIDDPRKLSRDVRPFLKRMKVTFPTYIKQTRDDEAFINALSPEWSGALPATFIFDRTGELVHTIVDATTFDELSAAVEPLLGRLKGN